MARSELGTELPTGYPRDFEFRMGKLQTLEDMATLAEIRIWPFTLQRRLLTSIAREVLGGGHTISVVDAIDLGAATYEATLGYLPDLYENDEIVERYDDELAQMLSIRGIYEFMGVVNMNEDALKARLEKASARLETDAPEMHGVVSGVIESHLRPPVLQQYALYGASAMRGLHILLDRRIARGASYVDTADPDNELSQLITAQDLE